jgi:hypothetical protein
MIAFLILWALALVILAIGAQAVAPIGLLN